MKLMSCIHDTRIKSTNLYLETTYGEYLEYAKRIVNNNVFQRKRVKNSKSVYVMLKNDLIKGCVIPPIVLAIASEGRIDENICDTELQEYMSSHTNEVMILDGLQRTYTLIDAEKEIDDTAKEDFYAKKLRLEVYININKFGILYRMLTLNTGQTPMSPRHQIEMLYRSKIDTSVEGVKLIADTQGKANPENNEFIFKNVIDGFCSYMNRNELPIDRQDILDNISMLENMSDERVEIDLFEEYLAVYTKVFTVLTQVAKDCNVNDEVLDEYRISGTPFAMNVHKAFSTSQAMTGFGAALGVMKDKKLINSISDVLETMEKVRETECTEWFYEFLGYMDQIRNNSKKIGNAQRMFLKYFFRELLNRDGDSYADLHEAVCNGYRKYDSQVN